MIKLYLAGIDINVSQNHLSSLLQAVSEDARERFFRFHFLEDSLRSLYGEIMARYLVSMHFNIKNAALIIEKTAYGKPLFSGLPIDFSISHSHNWVLCGISTEAIGVDIERIKNVDLSIAKRFFSKKEHAFLLNRNELDRINSFYDLWTLKESYIKWLGLGLNIPLDTFSFDISASTITLTDSCRAQIPCFRQYPLAGYKLSVCTTLADLPASVEYLDINKICLQ